MSQDSQTYKVIIAGGGTGGHVFPAIAIANQLQEMVEKIEILFVGAQGKLEMTKVPEAGYRIIGLPISGFQRSLSLRNLLFPFKLLISLWRSMSIIRKFKPDAAIGVGGYASGPLLYMASLRNIPTVIQEQNSYPGITNKLLAKRAERICVAYDGMDRFFDADKIVKTGNPVRKAIREASMDQAQAKQTLGFDPDKPMVLSIGGSLGARTLNDSLLGKLDAIIEADVQLYWQCGKLYHESLKPQVAENPLIGLTQFISNMEVAYAAADVIISRAGALSISELCLIGKPVILVPSPNVSEDHQTKNAMALVDRGAAVFVADQGARETLVPAVLDLLKDKEKQISLGQSIKSMARNQAAEDIAATIIKTIEERK